MKLPQQALKLGFQLVQGKLGQVMGDPGFLMSGEQPVTQELPLKDRSVKIIPPRIINPG